MSFSNELSLFVAGHRPLKKVLRRFLPPCVFLPMEDGFRLALDPLDLRGPSFHMARGRRNPAGSLGSYEPLQRKLVEEALLKRGGDGIFLDIGANIGLFAFPLASAHPRVQVFGFEPHPRNILCFVETLKWNRLDNVKLVRSAVGDTDGECRLFFDESDSGGHSTMPENLWNNHGATEHRKVRAVKLDTFIDQYSLPRLDVVKIDVQGAEDGVLKGGKKSLSHFLPDLLIEAQHEKVRDEGAIEAGVREISDRYRFRTMESPEWRPLTDFPKISAERFAQNILFADYFFSVPT